MKFMQFAIGVTLFIVTGASAPAQEKFVISTFPEAHPIAQLCQPIVQMAYEQIGIEIAVQHYPIARAIELANDGHTDGELCRGAGVRGNFPNLVMVPVPIVSVDVVVFTKDIEFPVEGWESVRPYRLGIQRGFKLAEANTRGMKTYFTTMEQAFYMLDAGRVDIVVVPRITGFSVLKNIQLRGIHMLSPPLQQDILYHFVHKQHQYIVPKLADTLENMNKTGKREAIQQQAEAAILQ